MATGYQTSRRPTRGDARWRSPSSAPATWLAASPRARSPAATRLRCVGTSQREGAARSPASCPATCAPGRSATRLHGDVVVLAIPYTAVDDVLGALRRPARRQGGRRHHEPGGLLDASRRCTRAPAQPLRRSPARPRARGWSRRSTRRSPARCSRAGRRPAADVFLASDDEDAKQPSARSSTTAACARSTPARWRGRASSRRSATCTWRCRIRWARGSPAR